MNELEVVFGCVVLTLGVVAIVLVNLLIRIDKLEAENQRLDLAINVIALAQKLTNNTANQPQP